jgi:hypothetical protein
MPARLCGALCALVVFAAHAPAAPVPPVPDAKPVTFPFRDKAPVVVQLNGLGAARERLDAMLTAALPDDAPKIKKQVDAGFDALFAGRKLTAIAPAGRVYLTLEDVEKLDNDAPALAVFVPVTGYKEFRETFLTDDERKSFEAGRGVDEVKLALAGDPRAAFMVDLKEYVAITPDRGTADTYAKKFARATSTAMPPECAKAFLASDLGLYVNVDFLNDTYGDQIRGFKQLIDFGLQQAQMGVMLPGINKAQLETAKTMIGGAFQAVEDCRGVAVGIEFRPEGLALCVQAQFAEDTPSARVLKAEAPGALADVAKLPAGLAQYSGSKFGPKFADVLRGLNQEFAPADDDEKGAAALADRLKEVLAAGPKGDVTAAGPPEMSLTVGTYADPEAAVKALAGRFAAVGAGGRVYGVVQKNAAKLTPGARKHRGFTFTEIKLALDFEATAAGLPEPLRDSTIAQLKRAITEKSGVWVGTDGKSVVQATGTDWDACTKALDSFLDGKKQLGEVPGYKLTRKNLPADANMLMLLETGHTVTSLFDSVGGIAAVVPGFPQLGKLKPAGGEPAYIGIAVTLKNDAAGVTLFVPGTALASGRKMLADVLKLFD